jgi:hypothetical protein
MTDDEAPKMMLPDVEPHRNQLRESLKDWLSHIEENDSEAFARLGGDSASMDEIMDVIMEEQTPETTRNLLLSEYDRSSDEEFRKNIEAILMGYGWNDGRHDGEHGFGDFLPHRDVEHQVQNIHLNNTSTDPLFRRSNEEVFDQVWDTVKGKFRGYSKNNISGRAERQGKARAWSQSRKVKRGRTRKRYARDKKRGNVRPRMRRQLGAGGSRKETKR